MFRLRPSSFALLLSLPLAASCGSSSNDAEGVEGGVSDGESGGADGGGTPTSDGGDSPKGDGGNDAGVDAGPPPRSTEEPTITREPVLTLGGSIIWDLAFLPDGSALFTVRSGALRKLTLGNTPSSTVVANAGSAGNPLAGLFAEGQSGLMGVAVDPAFATNRRIYLYFSHDASGTKDNRVVRYRLTPEDTLTDRTDIVTGISYKAAATANGGVGAHSGGRLRFGPDGMLYLTTGDNHSATIPQNVEALGSKVLRFTTDGAPAPGNPNLGSRNLIWALGFRNPQGISFHPWYRSVFISEHGPGNDDEVTKLTAGANGGWNPNNNGQYNGYSGARMTDTTAVPTAVAPIWKHDASNGMSPCTFLRGTSWKAWDYRLAVGFLNGRKIEVLDFDESLSNVVDTKRFSGVTERVRSLVMGPDEKLYVTTDSGDIFRFSAQ
ncbi:MAG: PQQ-dependent sugar dehydrogenase [Labilithrix sp.]|nr:PQQ-dependent sugar dehydrogenase [Labilithrix sp.]